MVEELWTLTLKGDDIEAYNNRFHELALMCPDLVPNEKKKIKRYTKGFPKRIKGNITSSRPTKLHDAINLARELVEQAVQGKAARINEAIKGNGKNTRKTTPTTITPTPVTTTATTTINTTNRRGGWKLPGPMPQLQLRDVTCFGCIEKGHYRHKCPKRKNQSSLRRIECNLYPVTKPSTLLAAFVSTSFTTWHQRLGHPGDEVLRSLSSRHFISCNKAKSTHVCHACQLDSLHKKFDMTDLEALNYFLGISTVRHLTGLFLSQKKYALQLLERAHMANCNPSRTPADTDSKLVQQICLYMHDPRELHFAALKRILRYVQGTLELGLHLYAPTTTSLVGGIPGFVETAWIRNILRELHSPLLTATLVYCDNAGHVRVLHVPSRFQYADIFTEGLPSALFEDFRSSLSVRPPSAQTAGAY
nr:hypothetical protein [Tanacetum cinerariifolium]